MKKHLRINIQTLRLYLVLKNTKQRKEMQNNNNNNNNNYYYFFMFDCSKKKYKRKSNIIKLVRSLYIFKLFNFYFNE